MYSADEKQNVRDQQNPRKYFSMIPNIVDDSDLDPYERTLYLHYVRVGTCTESTQTTAEKTHMSAGKVCAARKSLAAKGWIELDKSAYGTIEVTIVDRWAENMAAYASTPPRSPHELSVHHMNGAFTTRTERSCGEPKNNQLEKPVVEDATASGKNSWDAEPDTNANGMRNTGQNADANGAWGIATTAVENEARDISNDDSIMEWGEESLAERLISQTIFGLGWKERAEIREYAKQDDANLTGLKEALPQFRAKVENGDYRATWGALKKFWANILSTNKLRAGAAPPNAVSTTRLKAIPTPILGAIE